MAEENQQDTEEEVTEAVADEPVADDAAAAGEASDTAEQAVEEPVAEAAADEPAPEVVEEPVAEVADDAAAEDAAEPAAASGDGEAAADAVVPKRKKKRLPRALRPARTRRKRVASAERKPIVRLEKPETTRGRRQERQGTVVSDAMDKTIVVKVDVTKAHRRYKKVVRRSVKFHAHDEGNEAKVGDVVRIVETRPVSATKRWRLVEIVEAAK